LAYFPDATFSISERYSSKTFIHRLDDIADVSKNDQARVHAIKVLEAISDQADEKQRPGAAMLPGLQIVIVQSADSAAPPQIIGPTFAAPAALPVHTIDHDHAPAE
jgi:hypothetical protein